MVHGSICVRFRRRTGCSSCIAVQFAMGSSMTWRCLALHCQLKSLGNLFCSVLPLSLSSLLLSETLSKEETLEVMWQLLPKKNSWLWVILKESKAQRPDKHSVARTIQTSERNLMSDDERSCFLEDPRQCENVQVDVLCAIANFRIQLAINRQWAC